MSHRWGLALPGGLVETLLTLENTLKNLRVGNRVVSSLGDPQTINRPPHGQGLGFAWAGGLVLPGGIGQVIAAQPEKKFQNLRSHKSGEPVHFRGVRPNN
jgi:hypothetical protein